MNKPHHRGKSQLTIFNGLSEDETRQLDKLSSLISLESHSYLFHQHSPANAVYMIEDGALMIERSAANGKRQILAFVHPGNFIGFTHNEYYEFSVQTLTAAKLTKIPRRQFIELSDVIPQLKHNVRQISSNVLAHTMDQVFALGQKKANERVCFLLHQLLQRKGEGSTENIDLVMTRQDIADYLGLTIETVSRTFAKLKKDGIIDIHFAHVIEILDMQQLRAFALAT